MTGLVAALALAAGSMAAVPAVALAADNQAPVVTAPDGPIHISEAAPLDTMLTLATFTDDSAGPWTIEVWGFGGQSGGGYLTFSMSSPGPVQVPWPPYLDYTGYQVTVRDGELFGYVTGTVIMDNIAPDLAPLTIGIYTASGKAETHSNIGVYASITDPGTLWPDRETITCTLDYGDGQGPQPGTTDGTLCYGGVTYWDPGVYAITMTVTDAHGGSDTQSTTVTVIADALTVTVDPIPTINEGDVLTPAATFGGGLPWATYSCTVDYGDGTVAAGTVVGDRCIGPAHQGSWGQSGDYPVWFTVTDDMGETGINVTGFSYVNAVPTITSVSPLEQSAGVPASLTVTFDDPGLGATPAESYQCWIDWGDWTSSGMIIAVGNTCTSPEHVYGSVGTYTVRIEIFDGADLAVQDFELAVPGPIPHITQVNAPDSVAAGTPVSPSVDFTSSGLSETCSVDYGDATYADGTISGGTCTAPEHVYAVGTYTLSFHIWAADGGYDSASKTLTVINPAPVMGQVEAPDSVVEGTAVQATASFTSSGLAETCSVDFGDGASAAGTISGGSCAAPSHVYLPGTYAITFTIAAANGTSASGSATVTVTNEAPAILTHSLAGTPAVGAQLAVAVTFSDPGFGSETYSCRLDYGDGSGPLAGMIAGDTCTGPLHTYASQGTYTIVATVTDSNGGVGTLSVPVAIENPQLSVGPVSVAGKAIEGQSVTASAAFVPVGSQTYTCSVDYGDGTGALAGTITDAACKGPSHKLGAGSFTVTVLVTGSAGSTGQSTVVLSVANVGPAFTRITIPTTVRLGATLTASVSFSDPGTAETYQVRWIWGDGSTTYTEISGATRTFSATHRYAAANVYAINISLTDGALDDAATVYYNPTVAMYDPARSVSGSGTFASPAGSCTISRKCAAASTAQFSLSASYARGATRPTAKFTFAAAGISFAATSYDWLVAANGSATMTGTGKVNGVSGFRYYVSVSDANPDWIEVYVLDGHGNTVYLNNGGSTLRTGSITVK